MRRPGEFSVILLWLIAAGLLHGQDSPRGKGLNDPLLDKLVGDWKVERKLGSGRTAENLVHVEWVLQHQFVELHYRDVAAPPKYEAIVLIGYDGIGKRYICHWADITRVRDSRRAKKSQMRWSSGLSSMTAS
jgi:hypothetical protein